MISNYSVEHEKGVPLRETIALRRLPDEIQSFSGNEPPESIISAVLAKMAPEERELAETCLLRATAADYKITAAHGSVMLYGEFADDRMDEKLFEITVRMASRGRLTSAHARRPRRS